MATLHPSPPNRQTAALQIEGERGNCARNTESATLQTTEPETEERALLLSASPPPPPRQVHAPAKALGKDGTPREVREGVDRDHLPQTGPGAPEEDGSGQTSGRRPRPSRDKSVLRQRPPTPAPPGDCSISLGKRTSPAAGLWVPHLRGHPSTLSSR